MINNINAAQQQRQHNRRARVEQAIETAALPQIEERKEEDEGDRLEISNRAKELTSKLDWLTTETRRMSEQAQNAREAMREQNEELRRQRIAQQIAARIIRGDNVPIRDENFLLEVNPGLYKLAMSARNLNNDDPKDYDALSEKDGERQTAAQRVLGQDMAQFLNSVSGAEQ